MTKEWFTWLEGTTTYTVRLADVSAIREQPSPIPCMIYMRGSEGYAFHASQDVATAIKKALGATN